MTINDYSKLHFNTFEIFFRYGEDTVSCQLQCEGKSGVQLQTLHPDALDKIARIELTGTLVIH